jgi:hypothetical protein
MRTAVRYEDDVVTWSSEQATEPDWWAGVWDDATAQVAGETGLSDFPDTCPWSRWQVLDQAWLPD